MKQHQYGVTLVENPWKPAIYLGLKGAQTACISLVKDVW